MLHTANLNRTADHRGRVIDVTVKSAPPEFEAVAPTWELVMGSKRGTISWPEYERRYLELLRDRWRTQPLAKAQIQRLVALALAEDVTIVCYCREPAHCHRSLLAEVLAKIARAQGRELLATIA